MSLFEPAGITCPQCGTLTEMARVASVNADRRPDLRAAILDGSFQALDCPKCGAKMRLPPHLTYVEIGRKTYIAAEPVHLLDRWPEVEAEIVDIYDVSFGENASPAAQEIAEGMLARVVFGWPAFREKLICIDLGLDDTTLELLKMAVMRDVQGPPMADTTELRLVGGDAETLHMTWFVTASEKELATVDVPRDVYQSIVDEPEPWEVARSKLEGVALVDLRRLIVPPRLAA